MRQLKQASFIARCRSVFRKHGVSPTCFELEVTETTLMTDPKRTIGLLNELYAMGLNLAIDDFGTGYSSLSALQQFPIGTLKIDQSFVRDVAVDYERRRHRANHHRHGQEPRPRGHRGGRRGKPSSSSSCARTAATTRRGACSAMPWKRTNCSAFSPARKAAPPHHAQLVRADRAAADAASSS